MARPLLKIDPEQVMRLASVFCTNEEIALVLGCSSDTLTRRFAESIEKGRAEAKASLRRKQWEAAEKGDRTMLVWLGKNMLGQSDRQAVEMSGPEGGPVQFEELAKDARERLTSRIASIVAAKGANELPGESD